MQQIDKNTVNTKDLNQIIPRNTRGLAKQVKTEVITAIYNRYYVNKT